MSAELGITSATPLMSLGDGVKRSKFVKMDTHRDETEPLLRKPGNYPSGSVESGRTSLDDDGFASGTGRDEEDREGSHHGNKMPQGVQLIEAITKSWGRSWIFLLFILIWLIYFTDSLQQQANYSWAPYVTSAFRQHSLTGVTAVVAGLVSSVVKFPLAKFIDVVGRPQGFSLMLLSLVIALVLMALCTDVETFCVAQVFYWTGINGMSYVMGMFINDTTTLRNRGLALAITGTPFICNTFLGPALAQRFLNGAGWRWGYGAFAIITPIMCLPFLMLITVMIRRVRPGNSHSKPQRQRSWLQSVKFHSIEFDLVGQLLICGGFSIFLLPFSLAAYQDAGWRSPLIISMIFSGALLIALFVIWEKYWAPKKLFPFHLLLNRSLICASLIDANVFLAAYCYGQYFTSYLQVVFQQSVARTGWINNIYNLVSTAWGIPLTMMFSYTDRYKWAVVGAVPCQIFFVSLLIRFRSPDTPIGHLVMAQGFQSIFASTLVAGAGIGIQAAVPHEHLAIALAIQGMITGIGCSIGQTVATSMWTQLFLPNLKAYLPAESKDNLTLIYGSLEEQLSYAWGTPTRTAIVKAYGDTYRVMLITGTLLLAPLFVWTIGMNNYRLSRHQNLKGAFI